MTLKMNRRAFGGLLGSSVAASTLASVGAFAAGGSIRLIWWGNPTRDKRTYAVADLYKKTTGESVTPETYAWGDYWQKLATMAAGRNLPDVLQMDYRYIFEWARRNQLAPLDPFFGKEIDISHYDPKQLDSGKVDGKTYGISLGANSMSFVYKKPFLEKAGITLPDQTKWTTDDFMALGKKAKDKLPKGVYWSAGPSGNSPEPMLQTWLRSKGKDLYTADGKLGFDDSDLAGFFGYWKTMQKEGLTPPADLQAQDSGKMEESMMVTGHAVFDFLHSNQLVAMQNLNKDEVDLVMIPNAGTKPGQYMKPSMFFSMSAGSSDKAAAAKFIDFFVTNPAANKILLIERGVTADSNIRKEILPLLNPTEQKIITYLNVVQDWVSPLPPPPPKNAGEVSRQLVPAWQAVAFGQLSPQDQAKAFVSQAKAILAR